MSKYFIRVNGTGNAWPVPLGTNHPFYDRHDPEQLANVSFSLIKSRTEKPAVETTEWEILIDAGHGVVQYLIRHGNRLPEAILLTHAHLDHTLSMDWIIQSYFRHHGKQKKIPVYGSGHTLDFVDTSFPHLNELSDFRELKPGVKTSFTLNAPLNDVPELSLTPMAVYHGERAGGPLMLVLEIRLGPDRIRKIIFSGDLFCPLLRKADYRYLKDADLAFLDSNNRFPYTGSNHWSVSPEGSDGKESKYLKAFRQEISCTHLIAPHLKTQRDPAVNAYFDEFLAYCNEEIPLSVFGFCGRITPRKAMLVHYSGMEDRNYNSAEILNPVQLENWANAEAERRGISSEFHVPFPGQIYPLDA